MKKPGSRVLKSWRAVFLKAAEQICDAAKNEQVDFVIAHLRGLSNTGYGADALYNEMYYGDGVNTFNGWHGDLQNLEHVECRVIALCLCAAMCEEE